MRAALFTKTLFASLAGCLLLALLAQFAAGPAQAQTEPTPFKTAWLGEHEAFPVWLAKEKGWDREAGLAIEMLRFDTGRALVEGVTSYKWVVAGCGALPVIGYPMNDRLAILALANDESAANAVFVRKGSAILQKKGVHPDYPNVYGDAQSVQKITILCPRETSAHYTMDRWLYALGLTNKDVRVQFMDPAQAVNAFSKGMGDALVVWAPWYYGLDMEKCAVAATGSDCGAFLPTVLLENKTLEGRYAREVAAFVGCYVRAAGHIAQELSSPDTVAEYRRFLKEWAGREVDAATAEKELSVHKLYSLADQLPLVDTSKGESVLYRELKKMTGLFNLYSPSPEVRQLEVKVPAIDTRVLEGLGAGK